MLTPRCTGILLAAIAAISRLGLYNRLPAEPDSTLFLIGMRQWLVYGPQAAQAEYTPHYYVFLSPGYYWLVGRLANWLHAGTAQLPGLMNGISGAAAIGAAPLLFVLARRWLTDGLAAWASAIFLLTPGIWWLGLEAHAEGLAITLALLALYCYLRALGAPPRQTSSLRQEPQPRRIQIMWLAAAGLTLTASLLVRSDGVLLFPAWVLIPFSLPIPKNMDGSPIFSKFPWLQPALWGGAICAAASLAFLWLRSRILGISWAAAQQASERTVAHFWGHIHVLVQILPMLTSPGPELAGFALTGIYFAWRYRRQIQLRRWGWLIAGWSLPGYCFWFLIRGNVTRHVVIEFLPLLWCGMAGWAAWAGRSRPRQWGMIAALIAAWGVGWWIIPANSNMTLYPSGNVPASLARLHAREKQLQILARRLVAQSPVLARRNEDPRPPYGLCYAGSYTGAYLMEDWLLASGSGRMRIQGDALAQVVTLPVGGAGTKPPVWHTIALTEAYNNADYARAVANCRRVVSAEFRHGQRRWFFGRRIQHIFWLRELRKRFRRH